MFGKLMVVIVLGLSLALAGCAFTPDLGDRPQCERDGDCIEYGDCACVGGKCVPASPGAGCNYDTYCEAPKVRCDQDCADLQTDPAHCGGCEQPCTEPPPARCQINADGQDVAVTYVQTGECIGGGCDYSESATQCPSGCLDGACLGNCEMACDAGELCVDGACRCGGDGEDCDADEICCGSVCTDPTTDVANCTACGIDCNYPPPPYCLDAFILATPIAGPCSDNGCAFAENLFTCQIGCSGNACLEDSCGGACANGEECQNGECVCQGDGEICQGDETCWADGCRCGLGLSCNEFEDCIVDKCFCAPASRACTQEETCLSDGCVCAIEGAPCLNGLTCCGGLCVDIEWDQFNCGDCGIICGYSVETSCQNGNFWVAETTGVCMGWSCETIMDSVICDHGCDPDAGCLGVSCDGAMCDPGETCENGLCHCGAIGEVCGDSEICCWSQCVEWETDSHNCGECGHECHSGLPNVQWADCGAGVCEVVCEEGFGDCSDNDSSDGCETNLLNDVFNCSECGYDCHGQVGNADPVCNEGECNHGACLAPFSDCDDNPGNGCEANLQTDPFNCGDCGNGCGNYEACYAGTCESEVAGEVPCGQDGAPCTDQQYCCIQLWGVQECLSDADGDFCSLTALYCDGPEDCPADTSCCLDPWTWIASCSADNMCEAGSTVCHSLEDCVDDERACVDQDLGGGVTIGLCVGS